MQPERTSMRSRIGRALPRVLGVIFGVVIMRVYADHWVSWVGYAVFLFSVLPIALHPVQWWSYVTSGVVPGVPTDDKYTQPGPCQVELVSAGSRPIEVVRALREVCSLGVVEAKQLVEDAPTRIASNISESSAAEVCERIGRAGGAATPSSAAPGPGPA